MNKKGIATVLIDFYATVIIVLILIIFFAISYAQGGHREAAITARIGHIEKEYNAINLLRTKFQVEDTQMTLAELISRIEIGKNKEILEKLPALQANKLNNEKADMEFSIFIYDEDNNELFKRISPDAEDYLDDFDGSLSFNIFSSKAETSLIAARCDLKGVLIPSIIKDKQYKAIICT